MRINSDYEGLCCQFDEDIVVDLLNELQDIEERLKTSSKNSKNKGENNGKIIEAYQKYTKLLYQEFTQLENSEIQIQNKEKKEEEVKEARIDVHIENLTSIHNIFEKYLPKLQKFEAIASKSGNVEVSIIALDTHIFSIKVIERCLRYQKSL